MLQLDGSWVWDFWFAQIGPSYHIFYLQAPKSLGDERLRHKNATIGHAASTDLISWSILPDAFGPGSTGAWDDLATWTGSIVQNSGVWHMLYTGVSSADNGLIQRIGLATSSDLILWTKHPANPVIAADRRWYELLDHTAWREQAWRDPWVFRDPDGHGFHALITARAARGRPDGRGVVGHAVSDNLVSWKVQAPLTESGEFGHLEVLQVETVDGKAVLMFSSAADDVSERRRRRGPVDTTTYICLGQSLLGPFDLALARPTLIPHLYSGRLVHRHDGSWVMLSVVNVDAGGRFVGEIGDPISIVDLGVPGLGSGL